MSGPQHPPRGRQAARPMRLLAPRLLLTVLLAAFAWRASADWRDEYRRGREAFDNNQWSVAAEAMRAAIAERSEERSGSGFLGRRYTPRFYLGVALAELGDCKQAIELFDESLRLGQIQETVDSRTIVVRKEVCEEEVAAALALALADARKAVQEAEQARQPLAGLPEELGAQWDSGEPSLESQQDRADDLLRQARQRLDQAEARGTGDGLDEASRLAEQATTGFRAVVTEASKLSVAIAQRAVADARSNLTESVASAERSLRAVRDLAPYPERLGQRVQALREAAELARERSRDATPAEVETLRQAIADAQDALAPAARRPPRRLLDAAQRFLTGDWTGTLEALEGVRSRERRARSQVCILRAAAAWSLVELTPPVVAAPDEAMADGLASSDDAEPADPDTAVSAAVDPDSAVSGAEARVADAAAAEETAADADDEPPPPTPEELLASAIEGCRTLDPQPVPEAPFFSPRFLAFFEQALSAPALDGTEEGDPAAAELAAAGAQP